MVIDDVLSDPRLLVFRRYLLFSLGAHLIWELAHLPLYADWQAETPFGTALFLAHCILGDVLLAATALVLALFLLRARNWPRHGYGRVTLLAIVLGLAGTVLVEWRATGRLGLWAYSTLMPIIPYLDVGLSPVAQWLLIPSAGLWWAARALPRRPDGASCTG